MGIRRRIAGTLTGLGEEQVREIVERVLAARAYVGPGDLNQLSRRVDDLATPATSDLTALTERVAALEKKISMAMGAVQAGTAQLMSVKRTAEEAHTGIGKGLQAANSALATSESAADGINELELRLEALEAAVAAEPAAKSAAKKKPAKKKTASKKTAAKKDS